MHKSYQPLKPAANLFLTQRWDQARYEDHRDKVKNAKPVVDTEGIETPAHIQKNLKKIQLQKERMSIIERDNHLLASKLSAIAHSNGLVDNWNYYQQHSLNAQKRKETLLQVTRENQDIYRRIITQRSDYRRELWESEWVKKEKRRDDIARYPREETNRQSQKPLKVVKFSGRSQQSSSGVEEDSGETTEEEEP